MQISDFNPWWKLPEVPEELVGQPRDLLTQVLSFLDYRQIILLFGIRRAGKTTLMHQLIDHLLRKENVDPFRIVYFSFDLQDSSLEGVVEHYQLEVLKQEIRQQEKIYLFLDEIQKLSNWPDKVKILYDRYPNLKIFLSGSAALLLKKGIKESLAGRFFEFQVDPLSFNEFLEFKSAAIDTTREQLYEREIKILLKDFLITGGFAETLSFSSMALKKYFRESLIERVIFRDIPESFQINRPGLLFSLLEIIAGIPGLYLEYSNLGNDLKVDQRTVANYISYLSYSLLVNKLYNYSANRLTSEKKLKRVYLSNTGIMTALNPESEGDLGILLETFFANWLRTRFFFRSPQKNEVDFILCDRKKAVPVEVKIREKIRKKDLRSLKKFMQRFNCRQAVLISKKDERTEKENNREIVILPYWKYWSIKQVIGDLTDWGDSHKKPTP
jgi:predicted AAA+ superfamily ATPase